MRSLHSVTAVYCSLCGELAMPIPSPYFFRDGRPVCAGCFFSTTQKIQGGTAEAIGTAKVIEILEKAGLT